MSLVKDKEQGMGKVASLIRMNLGRKEPINECNHKKTLYIVEVYIASGPLPHLDLIDSALLLTLARRKYLCST